MKARNFARAMASFLKASTLVLILIAKAEAKIGDCTPITDGDVVYRTHANYVEAYDNRHQNVLWHTKLFSDLYRGKYDPNLEQDVQLNIACVKALQGQVLELTDGNGTSYRVDTTSGKLLDSR